MMLPRHWEPRIYRTSPGFWGLGLHHSPAKHWSVQIGRWVFTTEPE